MPDTSVAEYYAMQCIMKLLLWQKKQGCY